MYCVIMGDIIHSKEIEHAQRTEYMSTVKNVLQTINSCYYDIIYSPFKIVRGDAFEGVLYTQCQTMDIMLKIIGDLLDQKGIKVRLASASGPLTSLSIVGDEADGPAFHTALKGLEHLKEKDSDHWFQIYLSTGDQEDPMLEAVLALLSDMTSRWTQKQSSIVLKMVEFSRIADNSCKGQQKKVARFMGMKEPAISRQLKAINYDLFRSTILQMQSYLEQCEERASKRQDQQVYTAFYSMARRALAEDCYENVGRYAKEALAWLSDSLGPIDTSDGGYAIKESQEQVSMVPVYNSLARLLMDLYHSMTEKKKDMDKDMPFEVEKDSSEALNLLKEASDLLRQASIYATSLPKSNYMVIETMIIRGNLWNEEADYEQAVTILEEARLLAENLFGSYHPLMRLCYGQLCRAYDGMGDYDKALFYAKLVSEYAETEKEDNLVAYIQASNELARFYDKTEQKNAALLCLEAAANYAMGYLASGSTVLASLETLRRLIDSKQEDVKIALPSEF